MLTGSNDQLAMVVGGVTPSSRFACSAQKASGSAMLCAYSPSYSAALQCEFAAHAARTALSGSAGRRPAIGGFYRSPLFHAHRDPPHAASFNGPGCSQLVLRVGGEFSLPSTL